jgi:hypothetical protein
MVAVSGAGEKETKAWKLHIVTRKGIKTIECDKTGGGSFTTAKKSWHFGCHVVELGPSGTPEGTKDIDLGQSAARDEFKGTTANQYQVTYGDYIDLTGREFDPASCQGCFGFERSTTLSPATAAESKTMGDWYVPELPFTDPYIQYQPILEGAPTSPEYRPFAAGLGVPSKFPVEVPQLPRNVPAAPPPSYSVFLNLFDIYTMSTTAPTRAVLSLQANLPRGARLSATLPSGAVLNANRGLSKPFMIAGKSMPMGRLFVGAEKVPEGSRATFRADVQVVRPGGRIGGTMFLQRGTLIQDTRPPVMTGDSLTFTKNGILQVRVQARDATTSPVAANFWFSYDHGKTWSSTGLSPIGSLFDPVKQRAFTGQLSLPAEVRSTPGKSITYFFVLQDEVFNYAYVGVATKTIPS